MAFSAFREASRLETAPLPPTGSSGSPLLSVTRGLASTSCTPAGSGGASGSSAPAAAQLTLPDGRLSVGTHLPLLARRYRYLSTLGEGMSAQVILAEDTLAPVPSRLVAIKVMRRQHALAGQKEARALRFLHSTALGGTAPGVVRLLDTFQLGGHYCLVTDRLFPWLLDWIADSCHLPAHQALQQLRKMAHQLLVAVACLHNRGVVHADLKPDNLLFCSPPGSGSLALRLVDFGGCFSLSETDTHTVTFETQTLPYRAPEAALGLPFGAPIDLWSVGVVLAEMALKRALFPCSSPLDLLKQMAALLGPLPDRMLQGSTLGHQLGMSALKQPPAIHLPVAELPSPLQERLQVAQAQPLVSPAELASCQLCADLAAVDASLADLVMGLVAYDPSKRLTAQQALLHPFFDALCPLRAVFPQLATWVEQEQDAASPRVPTSAVQLPTKAATHVKRTPVPAVAPIARPSASASAAHPLSREATAPRSVHQASAAVAGAKTAVAAGLTPVQQEQPQQQQQQQQHEQRHTQPHEADRQPTTSQVSSAKGVTPGTEQMRRVQPWQALAAALAQRQAPQSRLAAAQLAARQCEKQQQLKAADPYAGSFSLAATPSKDASDQGAVLDGIVRHLEEEEEQEAEQQQQPGLQQPHRAQESPHQLQQQGGQELQPVKPAGKAALVRDFPPAAAPTVEVEAVPAAAAETASGSRRQYRSSEPATEDAEVPAVRQAGESLKLLVEAAAAAGAHQEEEDQEEAKEVNGLEQQIAAAVVAKRAAKMAPQQKEVGGRRDAAKKSAAGGTAGGSKGVAKRQREQQQERLQPSVAGSGGATPGAGGTPAKAKGRGAAGSRAPQAAPSPSPPSKRPRRQHSEQKSPWWVVRK